jgi:hypothetical protein
VKKIKVTRTYEIGVEDTTEVEIVASMMDALYPGIELAQAIEIWKKDNAQQTLPTAFDLIDAFVDVCTRQCDVGNGDIGVAYCTETDWHWEFVKA